MVRLAVLEGHVHSLEPALEEDPPQAVFPGVGGADGDSGTHWPTTLTCG